MPTLPAQKASGNHISDSRALAFAPSSNTGGNSDKISAHQEPFFVSIDTFSLTGKLDTLPVSASCFTDEHRINWISQQLSKKFGLFLSGDDLGGRNFFKHSRAIFYTDGRPQKHLGFVAWGGAAQRGSFQIYATGECCEYLNAIGLMASIGNLACDWSLRVTRSDIAFDDFEGCYGVDSAIDYYKSGGFTFTREPSISQVGNWLGNDKKGRTVYIGSRDSGKMLRVYEKGKQLGDSESKWVRWEVEIKAKDRVIPLDVFSRPDKYFAGSYPVLRKFVTCTVPSTIKTLKKKAKVTVEKAILNIQLQYGKSINVLSGLFASSDLVASLSREGVPSSLVLTLPKRSENLDVPPPIDLDGFVNDGLLYAPG